MGPGQVELAGVHRQVEPRRERLGGPQHVPQGAGYFRQVETDRVIAGDDGPMRLERGPGEGGHVHFRSNGGSSGV
jgi:hypothetical protein